MPSSSATHHRSSSTSHNRKRSHSTLDEPITYSVPSNDSNAWYYPNPANGGESDDSEPLPPSELGNWGNKKSKGARWVRKGKMVAWGPGMDDWQAEERARKRLRALAPLLKPARSPSPPVLAHLRSPSPPLAGPFPSPSTQHLSYTSFVLDKAITHTFRSKLVDDLERATNGFIEAEAAMKKALGRLWQAMSEDPDKRPAPLNGPSVPPVIPKTEDDEDMDDDDEDEDDEFNRENARRRARAPDLTPSVHKIFVYEPKEIPATGMPEGLTHAQRFAYISKEEQFTILERSLAGLRYMQDDGREYVERLEEIRDGLGDIRAKRDTVWDIVRRKALQELQETALNTAG